MNASTEDIGTVLMYAVTCGSQSCVEELIKAGADVNFSSENEGLTALYLATLHNFTSCAELLMEAGADVNLPSSCGAVPLGNAVVNGNAALAKLLINSGANVNPQNSLDFEPLMAAAINGRNECLELLLNSGGFTEKHLNQQYGQGDTPLVMTVQNGHLSCGELLIKAGVHVNASCSNRDTALIVAIGNGKAEESVKRLIELGADPNISGEDNKTLTKYVLLYSVILK